MLGSTATQIANTGTAMHTRYDTAKLLLGDNTTDNATIINGTGSEATFTAGTLLGRITASGNVAPHVSTATDGSQIPIGILLQDITLADAATTSITMVIGGEVNASEVTLGGSDTLDTVIDSRRLRDRIQGDTLGLILVEGLEMTKGDNDLS